ncbi:MAG: DNA-protecting protein DprA [Pseudomonadota bacterium]|jgi:DNA processing protein
MSHHDLDAPAFEIDARTSYFPTALSETHPPVVRLFGLGSETLVFEQHQRPGVAIVGSRRASQQGVLDAHWFAREISSAGLTIISGLATGIDAAAHAGGLEGVGKTIAVLGHGRDSVYPRSHTGLAQEICSLGGALITEYPDGVPARPHHFPQRNRIIAALARAVLVVEAAPKSGSLITARHALELGIDVFVIPGSIHDPQTEGSNQLIRQGAQLVQSPTQLLEDLGLTGGLWSASSRSLRSPPDSTTVPQLPVADRVLAVLTHHPTDVLALSDQSKLDLGDVHTGLLLLELHGLAARVPDGRWHKICLV